MKILQDMYTKDFDIPDIIIKILVIGEFLFSVVIRIEN